MKVYNNGSSVVSFFAGGVKRTISAGASLSISNQYITEIAAAISNLNAAGESVSADFADDAGQVLAFTSGASAGGSQTETMTVTGLLASDTILSVDQKTDGSGGKTIIRYGTPASNALSVTWDADPGSGAVVVVTVKR